jgi:hypothetical protein
VCSFAFSVEARASADRLERASEPNGSRASISLCFARARLEKQVLIPS